MKSFWPLALPLLLLLLPVFVESAYVLHLFILLFMSVALGGLGDVYVASLAEGTDAVLQQFDGAGNLVHLSQLAIPGTHETCRTEYLHDLAKQLGTCLSKVQAAELS